MDPEDFQNTDEDMMRANNLQNYLTRLEKVVESI